MANPAWIPAMDYLGHLPDDTVGIQTFPVPDSVPATATEIQVYAYISVQGLDPQFKRGYYEVYTKATQSGAEFKCYLNIANVQDTVLNSDNFWLPYGEGIDKAVYVRLASAEGTTNMKTKKPKRKCPKGDMKEHLNQRDDDDDQIFGEAFVTGYKVKS